MFCFVVGFVGVLVGCVCWFVLGVGGGVDGVCVYGGGLGFLLV